jgi:hypothetical protein
MPSHRLWNKPQGSELEERRVECPPAPNPSPIRRIIDDSLALTGAPAVKVGAFILCCRLQPGPRDFGWQFGWQCRLGEMMAEQPKAGQPEGSIGHDGSMTGTHEKMLSGQLELAGS